MIKRGNRNLPSLQINNTSFPHSVVDIKEGKLCPLWLQQVSQEAGRSCESLVETVRTVGRARSRLERVRLHELCELERPMEMLLVGCKPVIITNKLISGTKPKYVQAYKCETGCKHEYHY